MLQEGNTVIMSHASRCVRLGAPGIAQLLPPLYAELCG